jgi:hypothetical protein
MISLGPQLIFMSQVFNQLVGKCLIFDQPAILVYRAPGEFLFYDQFIVS